MSHARYASNMALGIVSLDTTCWSKDFEDLNAFFRWMSWRETAEEGGSETYSN